MMYAHMCARLRCDSGCRLATVSVWGSKGSLGYWSSPPSLFETGSLGCWLLCMTGQLCYQLHGRLLSTPPILLGEHWDSRQMLPHLALWEILEIHTQVRSKRFTL